jgi:hypothetical protein
MCTNMNNTYLCKYVLYVKNFKKKYKIVNVKKIYIYYICV